MNPIRYRGYHFDSETGLYYLRTRYYDPFTGRFISPDSIDVLESLGRDHINGLNLYSYCLNNPVRYTDGTGQFLDIIFDIAMIVWSAKDVIDDPGNWKNWAALAIDIVFAAVPFVPNIRGIIKIADRVDNFVDVARKIGEKGLSISFLSKATMIGRNMKRVRNTAEEIGISSNIYKAWEGYKNTLNYSKKLANAISAIHNGAWLFKKLRKGSNVIDIGMKAKHTRRGLWYGTETAVLTMWRTRNIWKLPINLYLLGS